MFKKIAFIALFTAAVPAMAVTDTLDFNIEANIPAERQYVKFANPAFGGSTQTMNWDRMSESLGNITTSILARNTSTTGNIEAHLRDAPELAKTGSPTDTIPLVVTIDGTTLPIGPANPVEVVTDTEINEQNLTMIVRANPTGDYVGGDYTGIVTMVFDHGI